MRTRAAVAVEAGKPFEVIEVNLEGPKAGEVLIRVKVEGHSHTDEFTRSGNDPEGIFPSILGHTGGGVVLEVGEGVTTLDVGDHVVPLYTPERRSGEYRLSSKTNLCQAIRVTTGFGAVINTVKVEIGSHCVVFGLGGIGLNVIRGLRMVGADQIVGVDLNNDKEEMSCFFGLTDFVSPSKVEGDLVAHLVELTGGGADYTFDAKGNTTFMRQVREAAYKGWGESVVISAAPVSAEISTRPFQLVTGRVWRGTTFGGAKGRTDVPKIVDWYMDGMVEIDPRCGGILTDANSFGERKFRRRAGGISHAAKTTDCETTFSVYLPNKQNMERCPCFGTFLV